VTFVKSRSTKVRIALSSLNERLVNISLHDLAREDALSPRDVSFRSHRGVDSDLAIAGDPR